MAELVEIGTKSLSAAIDPHGAELHWLRDSRGRDLLTDADPVYWRGRAPLLFPIVGRANGDVIRVDGVAYPMPKHGFARQSTFDLVRRDDASAVFRLTDSAATRAAYPFAFALEMHFAIEDATLSMTARIENPASAPLPASFGFHPAFAWPLPYDLPREAHRIMFGAQEPATLRILAADGTIAAQTRESPLDGRSLRLRDALFEGDALVWDTVRSSRVTYGAPGGPVLDIAFPDTPKLGIWTKPGAGFMCIEPWHGIADPHGFTGEFRDKPGVFAVPPGGEQVCVMQVTLVP